MLSVVLYYNEWIFLSNKTPVVKGEAVIGGPFLPKHRLKKCIIIMIVAAIYMRWVVMLWLATGIPYFSTINMIWLVTNHT